MSPRRLRSLRHKLPALLGAGLVVALALTAHAMIRAGQDAHVTSVTDTFARVFTAKFREQMEARLTVMHVLRGHLEAARGDPSDTLVLAADAVHARMPELQALNWVDTTGRIARVTPLEGNEAALGLDVLQIPVAAAALRTATASGTVRLTAPMQLAQGGIGVVGYMPLRRNGLSLGHLNIVFRTAPLVRSAMGTEAGNFAITITDSGAPLFQTPLAPGSEQFVQTSTIAVAGRMWEVRVAPGPAVLGAAQSLLDEAALLMGLALALGVGLLLHAAQMSRHRLHDREERFALAMRGATDGVFDLDPVTGDSYFSPRWFQMLGLSANAMPARDSTFRALVHPEDLEQIDEDSRRLMADTTRNYIECEFRMRHANGTWVSILSRAHVVRKDGRIVRIVGTHVDLTEMYERQRALERAAMTDDLTGLRNRRDLPASIEKLANRLHPGERLAVLHLDLDKFKSINDTAGHEAGDEALRVTADRLCADPANFDLIARVGGDEFLLVKRTMGDDDAVLAMSETLVAQVSQPFAIKDACTRVGASIGIAFVEPGPATDIPQAIANADIALKSAKALGRGRSVFFEKGMRQKAVDGARITAEIEEGLAAGQFGPFFQPQIDIATGRVVGFEALARWDHPTRGILPAGAFVPYAERSHLVQAIDAQVFRLSCRAQRQLQAHSDHPVAISVNVSTAQLSDPDLVCRLLSSAAAETVPPAAIRIEILETTLLSDRTANVIDNIHRLADAGFRLDLDDFGTGHTAIASLRNFPVSRIKLDKSLVSGVAADAQLQTIARTVIDLGTKLGIEVLAEGVEGEAEIAFLESAGCRLAQGFHIGRPMPVEAAARWMETRIAGKDGADRRSLPRAS